MIYRRQNNKKMKTKSRQLKKTLKQAYLTKCLHFLKTSTSYRSRQSFGKNIKKQSNPYPKKTKQLLFYCLTLLLNPY